MTKQWHPDEIAILKAIHTEPRDDTPRLVYADWLDEHDQPEYAEFIRWQVRNPAEMRIPRPSKATLTKWQAEPLPPGEERMRRMLGLHFGKWGRPCPSDTDLGLFVGGLPVTRVRWV